MRQGVRTVAGDSDPGFELCFLDADGDERRELPAAWPGLRPETFMPVREFRWTRGQKHLMGIWQVTALGDGALEPYGQIAGPASQVHV